MEHLLVIATYVQQVPFARVITVRYSVSLVIMRTSQAVHLARYVPLLMVVIIHTRHQQNVEKDSIRTKRDKRIASGVRMVNTALQSDDQQSVIFVPLVTVVGLNTGHP